MPVNSPLTSTSTLLSMSFFDAITAAELQRQKDVVIARRYHDGDQGTKLTARLQQFLSEDFPFRLNVARSVVSAVAERISVTGFDSDNKEYIKWVWKLWQDNKLDAFQEEIYEAALRDGESFVSVKYDPGKARAVLLPHFRYTDTEAGGDGTGVYIKYTEDDPLQDIEYATKQWVEYFPNDPVFYLRKTLYYPDRIEKYVKSSIELEWHEYMAPNDEEWPLPWVDSSGKPLGVAIIPFNNKGLQCEAWDGLPIQDAINKSLLDLLTASDMTAFRIFYALGFIPTTDGKPPAPDGSNLLELSPGQVVGTSKSRRDADFGAIDPSDLSQMQDLVHQLVLWLAMVTNTPVTRFVSTKLIASDETLKEQEGPLISRATSRQRRFGNSWDDVFKLAARLTNAFGSGSITEDVHIEPIWGDAAARGESEKMDLLIKKQKLEVPRKQLWREAGYDQIQIDDMEGEIPNARQPGSRDGNGRTNTGASAGADNNPDNATQ